MSPEGSKAKLMDLLDSDLKMEFSEQRTEETTGLYVTDLTKEPEEVARNLSNGNHVSFSNYGWGLGKSVEYNITNALKWKIKDLEDSEIAYGVREYKVCLSYVELGLAFNGSVDYLLYLKNREKIPIEIKTTSNKRYYDERVKNKERIQLMAYVVGLQAPYGVLIRINRNNGVYEMIMVAKDTELVIGHDAKVIPFWVHCRQWATRFHAERARLSLKKEGELSD